ncbi:MULTISPECIES: D-alanine--D-alanine ligase [unclassified Lentimonas]|uniref:D-alanine--D-alanine ligase family protein n=1 Tax=unclassified Lentimonas TaxID=2630993 RepID=UPI001322918F|nr:MULTISPECIES: D-alanine--D-alanine ligase [unclassified Lentimonas]CAA6678785.1 D-alanine--D-alanine ligase (EC [Lentimonas sp. CC4]CAA6684388.1 D-alanine--D-alanine ligase (EC [Lentimonas sp. CC6]CAA6692914.1 D-alanine--D-alanine ligase (EC [Lentimonas sp. CC19]CAA6695757.1 D-alanine--D-alanine ligase (EC [Lentimonas sp. CC10]CAA7069588.1 D-alanine--D-alanine ligase (EC [Lentimonas sp. CC11]
MANPESIVVLYGGVGSERDVSLVSGEAIAKALSANFEVELLRLDAEALPESIDGSRSIVFPALHGAFGEDGRLQALLEAAGVEYCGSDAAASRLCMAKDLTKTIARDLGIDVPEAMVFDGANAPLADAVIGVLGTSLVIKPTDQGSSVGLYFTEHRSALGVTLSKIHEGNWLIEQRIRGRELTVGVLKGAAMGVVEIVSASGVYDYEAKYTPGSTEYRYPAELQPEVEARIKADAEALFNACGCRDFARIDFLLDGAKSYFLEINTLPGLTATSLLPKSASCVGLDFESLGRDLVTPAMARFAACETKGHPG